MDAVEEEAAASGIPVVRLADETVAVSAAAAANLMLVMSEGVSVAALESAAAIGI